MQPSITHESLPTDYYRSADVVYIQQVNYTVLNEIAFYTYSDKKYIGSPSVVAVFTVRLKTLPVMQVDNSGQLVF